MQAWMWAGRRKLELVELPNPEPGRHEVLLRVCAVGICGTDLHIVRGTVQSTRPPLPLGHEIAGEVVACGPDVQRVRTGDRCCVDPLISCGRCDLCIGGQRQLCRTATEL